MSWLNHIRQRRWSAAWVIAVVLSVYLAFTGISSMVGGHFLPITGQENSTSRSGASLPTPEQMFIPSLAPPPTQESPVAKPKVSAAVGKPLMEAQALARRKLFREAMNMVKAAIAVPNKTPYEEAVTNEMLAYVALNLRDYATAAMAYEDTVAANAVPPEQMKARLEAIIKLNYQDKNYAKVQLYGQRYLKEIGPSDEISLLMAQAYYVQRDYANAEKLTTSLIHSTVKAGGKPTEDLLRLLMSCHHNMRNREGVIATLTQLLALYPTSGYWKDIFSYLRTAPKLTDRVNLEIYRLQLETSGLDAIERIEMVELSMALGLPGEAETILQQGFSKKVFSSENVSSRATRLLELAQENAIKDRASLASLDKESRNSSAAGYDSIKLGEVYLSHGKYKQAIEAINRGINKGNFAQMGEANLHLGIAQMKLNQVTQAQTAFDAVPKNSSVHKIAELWRIHTTRSRT